MTRPSRARVGPQPVLVAETEASEVLPNDALDGPRRKPAADARPALPDAGGTDQVPRADRLPLARADAVPQASEAPEPDRLAAPSAALSRAAEAEASGAEGLAHRVSPHRAAGVRAVAAERVGVAPRGRGRSRVGAGEGRQQAHGAERRRLAERGGAREVRVGRVARAGDREARVVLARVRVAHRAFLAARGRSASSSRHRQVAVLRARIVAQDLRQVAASPSRASPPRRGRPAEEQIVAVALRVARLSERRREERERRERQDMHHERRGHGPESPRLDICRLGRHELLDLHDTHIERQVPRVDARASPRHERQARAVHHARAGASFRDLDDGSSLGDETRRRIQHVSGAHRSRSGATCTTSSSASPHTTSIWKREGRSRGHLFSAVTATRALITEGPRAIAKVPQSSLSRRGILRHVGHDLVDDGSRSAARPRPLRLHPRRARRVRLVRLPSLRSWPRPRGCSWAAAASTRCGVCPWARLRSCARPAWSAAARARCRAREKTIPLRHRKEPHDNGLSPA